MKPLSATEAVAAIEAGTLTSEKLVRDCLDRIAEREPTVKAWAYPRSRPGARAGQGRRRRRRAACCAACRSA